MIPIRLRDLRHYTKTVWCIEKWNLIAKASLVFTRTVRSCLLSKAKRIWTRMQILQSSRMPLRKRSSPLKRKPIPQSSRRRRFRFGSVFSNAALSQRSSENTLTLLYFYIPSTVPIFPQGRTHSLYNTIQASKLANNQIIILIRRIIRTHSSSSSVSLFKNSLIFSMPLFIFHFCTEPSSV